MEETTGLLDKIRHHDKLSIALNENCAIPLPDDVMQILLKPHRLSFYYFQYIESGSATFIADLQKFNVGDGELAFGLPNQIFTKLPYDKHQRQYALSFDEDTLKLLPGTYQFLVNPFNVNSIAFDPATQQRVKNLLSGLFQLLHAPGRQRKVEVILAHLHTVLTEFNTAYFEQYKAPEIVAGSKLSKYIAFKLAVEENLTEQHDVQSIAEQLALTSNTLYGIVKEFGGVSPKEWIINRLMLEAQRKLQYSTLSVKELAYELGFNDPGYFSRLFKKSTGKSISRYLADLQDLSHD
ncbi:helix-turn-helix domain-containing protein [Chitinophaga pinensis]|uniref:Transcriptional regulator, AraC family n=1 Tax=Chitinophaga pinensis (strain ATCC 43595 / DSM 2588 / LMG 13176 / NBRC 15968 / NCIMB 11800 / UQM 2034) TaxID=485918 RepID=A0A979GYV5_CHIPD|nr:AraC family transcriptional regulator [Chitinophaga pinensis]ACU62060.1 transcriptional regulator, AraC family [Chitinophaga pinensis DSM 2588]